MTNQEILEKAIQKAIDNGWENEEMYSADNHIDGWLFNPGLGEYGGHNHPSILIFNHDFAKTLWGKYGPMGKAKIEGGLRLKQTPYWKIQLQNMVVADDPIKYLGEHLDDRPTVK